MEPPVIAAIVVSSGALLSSITNIVVTAHQGAKTRKVAGYTSDIQDFWKAHDDFVQAVTEWIDDPTQNEVGEAPATLTTALAKLHSRCTPSLYDHAAKCVAQAMEVAETAHIRKGMSPIPGQVKAVASKLGTEKVLPLLERFGQEAHQYVAGLRDQTR